MGPSHFIQLPIATLLCSTGRPLRLAFEIALLSALILATRCANYREVFVAGKVYFVDADCYSRMTRVRLVAEHPGLVVRQHDFENFPAGISPHTTAPLDYLIALLATGLRPLTAQPLDLAGAIVSPLLALAAGWFLWWWSRRVDWPGRWALLLVYALSAILVHGTALGRPDQQSLLIVTLLIALAAEYRLQERPSRGWGIVSGIGWGLALWVSLYEPLILLAALLLSFVVADRAQFTARARRTGWWILIGIILLAALIERRLPEWPEAEPFFANWSGTIGELRPVNLTNPAWLYWSGGLLLVSPFLLLLAAWRRRLPWTFAGLLALCFVLTIGQARWGYFFVTVFLLTIPAQFAFVRPGWRAGATVVFTLFPLVLFWDKSFAPNEEASAQRIALAQWRAVASSLAGPNAAPILAPWWLAPATAYWSGHPVVAGSSHESLPGIVATARFFLSTSPEEAWEILQEHRVKWVLAEDSERVAANSEAILGLSAPSTALCYRLDRDPTKVPDFLNLIGRNGSCTLYEVRELHYKFRSLRKPSVDMTPGGF
ncbi:MAG: hypothetical protein ACR2II_10515 [Chthoniobacterales bacterium]